MPEFGEKLIGWNPPPRPVAPRLEGQYATIEPLSLAHADAIHAANMQDEAGKIWDYLPYGPFADVGAYGDWLARVCARPDPLFLAIRDKSQAGPAGVASYLRVDLEVGAIEVGHICLAPALQKTRAATEAMYLMMQWVFEAGYRRYEWKCNALNLPSRRAAERFGFSYEGVFRQARIDKGRNRDTAWFAVIDKEWPALRAAYEAWLAPANFDGEGRQWQRLSELTAPVLAARDPRLYVPGA